MPKSATDIMKDIVVAAVVDAVSAMKAASRGVPNVLLRDLNAIHQNTAFADLPPHVQTAVSEAVRNAFTRMLRENHVLAPKQQAAPVGRPASDRPAPPPGGPKPLSRTPGPKRPRPKPSGSGGRQN